MVRLKVAEIKKRLEKLILALLRIYLPRANIDFDPLIFSILFTSIFSFHTRPWKHVKVPMRGP